MTPLYDCNPYRVVLSWVRWRIQETSGTMPSERCSLADTIDSFQIVDLVEQSERKWKVDMDFQRFPLRPTVGDFARAICDSPDAAPPLLPVVK